MSRTANSTCDECDTTFYKRPGQKTKSNNDFCSRTCHALWKKKQHMKVCQKCKCTFHPHNTRQKFCSLVCAASRPRVEKWNDNGKNKSQKILLRLKKLGWDGVCMVDGCDYKNTQDVHRIIPGVNDGEYTLDNIVVLCPNHHAEHHRMHLQIYKVSEFQYKLLAEDVGFEPT